MRTVKLSFVCYFLALAPTALAAGGSSADESTGRAALDFRVRIPHSLRLFGWPLAASTSEARAGTAEQSGASPLPSRASQTQGGARSNAVTILSTYRHVIIVSGEPGHTSASPPRDQAEITAYGTVRIGVRPFGQSPGLGGPRQEPGASAPARYTVATP